MKKWVLKAIVQKTISYLPFSNRINHIFQKYITKGVYLSDEYFYDRLDHAKNHLKGFSKFSKFEIPETCLELGTGWYPIVPISFYLIGTIKTYSVDISFLTSKERIKTTIEKFIEAGRLGKLKNYIQYKEDKLNNLRLLIKKYDAYSLKQILEKLNLVYLIEDARNLSLHDNSVDLVTSNNTFEHIYPNILIPIMMEFKRVVNKNDGVMSHFIDMSDHFAHFDKSINIYNFLQFSDNQWKWIDNNIQPQNRLRFDDYKKIYQDLELPISEQSFREGSLNEVEMTNIDKKYIHKPKEVIAISHCHLISDMAN